MSHALCALNNLILNGPCWSFHYIFEMFSAALENSLAWKYFYEQCVEDIFSLGRMNKTHYPPHTQHTHTKREREISNAFCFISLPHFFFIHTDTLVTSKESKRRTWCQHTYTHRQFVRWNSFICIQRTEICYCFFRFSIFHLAIFKWEYFFLYSFCLLLSCDSLLSVFEKRILASDFIGIPISLLIFNTVPGQWPNGIHT